MDHEALARRLYRALADVDEAGLRGLLHREFRAEISHGLPDALGGVYEGADSMIDYVRRVAQIYGLQPQPLHVWRTTGGEMIVRGRYRGQVPTTRATVDAAFVHVIETLDGQISSLHEVADGTQWHLAAAASGNLTTVRRVMAGVAARDAEAVFSAYAPEIEIREAESLPYGGVYRGIDGGVSHAQQYLATWDPVQTAADRDLESEFFPSPPVVVVRWRQKATGRNGARLDRPVLSVFELRRGRIHRLQMFHFDVREVAQFLAAEAG